MPSASGRLRGITVPRVPWHETEGAPDASPVRGPGDSVRDPGSGDDLLPGVLNPGRQELYWGGGVWPGINEDDPPLVDEPMFGGRDFNCRMPSAVPPRDRCQKQCASCCRWDTEARDTTPTRGDDA